MSPRRSLPAIAQFVVAVFLGGTITVGGAVKKEAKVTQVIREVNLLEAGAPKRPAALNDQVGENTAVRTGSNSKSELTFGDLTISRLGENSVFSFKSAGRTTELGGGAMLLRVPKDRGDASVRTAAVTVGVTGTTLILEAGRGGRSKLILLEGAARLALVKNARQTAIVRAGQMLDVPAGASILPAVQNVNLAEIMRTHPLIVGFRRLPSQDLITKVIEEQQTGAGSAGQIYQGRPVAGGGFTPTLSGLGGLIGQKPGRRGQTAGQSGPAHPTDEATPSRKKKRGANERQ